jgi:hypothetical protein
VNLDNDEIRAACWVFNTFMRERRIAGRPFPREVSKLLDRLTREYQTPSQSRQAGRIEREELRAVSARIGTRLAAEILGWSTRTVQRHAEDLGGELVGNGWSFREVEVLAYARRTNLAAAQKDWTA